MRNRSDNDPTSPQRASVHPGDRPAVSYLVRFWLEPGEAERESAPVRGYVRDLRTGEERYFGDPRRLAEHVLRQLHAVQQEQAEDSEPDRLRGAAG